MVLKTGDLLIFERNFTIEDVERFTQLSGDEGSHHLIPDNDGRLIIQGLLTATLPTKIGGDNNVLARKMTFEFLRPVFTGDTVVCEVRIEHYENKASRTLITATFTCRNQDGIEVMNGDFSGMIL